jgi:hypothetical protein
MLAMGTLDNALIFSARQIVRLSATLCRAMAKITADMQSITCSEFIITLSGEKVLTDKDLVAEKSDVAVISFSAYSGFDSNREGPIFIAIHLKQC